MRNSDSKNLSCLSVGNFSALRSICLSNVQCFIVNESQLQALYGFICGEEVFVNLPTGSGKSLIFQVTLK